MQRRSLAFLAVAAVATAAVGFVLAGGYLTGSARGLASQIATEQIQTSPLTVTAQTVCDNPLNTAGGCTASGSFTNLASITLANSSTAAGPTFIVTGNAFVRNTSNFPVAVECWLTAPNMTPAFANASLSSTKGSQMTELFFQGVVNLRYAGSGLIPGVNTLFQASGGQTGAGPYVATIVCRAPTTAANTTVIATNARLIALPVDFVTSNLKTGTP